MAPGPELITMGKLPLTPRAKRVIDFAIDEARTLESDAVDSVHLLLGLIREEEGLAAQVLGSLGAKLQNVRELKEKGQTRVQASTGIQPLRCQLELPPGVLTALRNLHEVPGKLILDITITPAVRFEWLATVPMPKEETTGPPPA